MDRLQQKGNYTSPSVLIIVVSNEGVICSSVADIHSATTEEWGTVDL